MLPLYSVMTMLWTKTKRPKIQELIGNKIFTLVLVITKLTRLLNLLVLGLLSAITTPAGSIGASVSALQPTLRWNVAII